MRCFFRHWIDTEHSAHRDTYQAYTRRLAGDGSPPFSRGPEAVFKRLCHALEAPRPKARYHVTVGSHLFKLLQRVLPGRLLDRVLLAATELV